MSTSSDEQRGDPRYRVHPKSIEILIGREVSGDAPNRVTLLDLSRGGLRLGTTLQIPRGEKISLRLRAAAINLDVQTSARVCWVQPAGKGGWWLGCALSERIDDEMINDLAVQSALDRRRDARQDVSFSAEARSELRGEFEPVQIVNYSAGGFRALTNSALAEPGERLMLRIPGVNASHSQVICGKVVWSRVIDKGYAVGCSFLTPGHYLQMHQLIDPHSKSRWFKRLSKHRPTHWRAVAAAILLILGVELWELIITQPHLVQVFDQQVIQRVEPFVESVTRILVSDS